MSLEHITIAAFAKEFGKRGLEFPGMTTVRDVMHDKWSDLYLRIGLWDAARKKAYFGQAIKYTASRMAAQEVSRRKAMEAIRMDLERHKRHFEEEVDSRLMCAAIIREARKLPELTQHMLGLAILGHSFPSIAKQLQVPLATVKSRLGRARRIIKKKMQ